MPPLLYLVRHGESTGNVERRFGGHDAMPLTPRGAEQAAAAARALAGRGVSAVYSSDLPRALDTARAIAAACGAQVRTDARLRERTLGVLDGVSFSDAAERMPDLFAAVVERRFWVCPPGGETYDECAARVASAVEEIAARHEDGRAVVVSHAMALHHGLRRLLGVLALPHTAPRMLFAIANGGWHVIERRDETWRVLAMNVTSHLGGAAEDVTT